ncbi:hypothetical protein ABL78_4153 [Leptomonas seymouri]|uniref:Treble clef zinc finger domain-containing protein n=1 Tax=Leptomonas seymouri TaxID=5684 RepID=A0A0N1IKX8_LEPSE|nr:hypothetical protein ABL78_4153 [Leptomonas seymouri]|eukprot:KPI86784.1 hypothetical protein ABL78_4153 [Leptomonas seymouri]
MSRRFGSGVSRESGAGRGRGRGRGMAATRMAASNPAVSDLNVAIAPPANATDKDRAEEEDKPFSFAEEEGDHSEDQTQLISPLTRRGRRTSVRRSTEVMDRCSPRKRSGLVSEEGIKEAIGNDIAGDHLEDVETPVEDPVAQAQDEDDTETFRYSSNGSKEEEDESRMNGVEEAYDTVGASSTSALEERGDKQTRRRAMSSTTRKRVDRGESEDGEVTEGEEDGICSSMSPSHTTDGDTAAFDTSMQDEGMANKFLAIAFPDLAAEYTAAGPKANKTRVEEVRTDSAVVAAWRCPTCSTTWHCGIFVRCILKNGCPHCASERSTLMATVRPDLLQLWDHNRNNPFLKPEEIPADSRETVYWNCPTCRESYTARVRDRVQDTAHCPSCALLRSASADALGSEAGALQQEWHPLKNGDLHIDQLAPMDRKTKVWWLCGSCGHEWEASLATRLSRSNRSKGKSCPACHGKGPMEVF